MKKISFKDGAIICSTSLQDECLYDVSNLKAMAQFDGCGSISRYSIADKWQVLGDEDWYSGISVNGVSARIDAAKDVYMTGKNQIIKMNIDGLDITVNQFMEPSSNGIFVEYIFKNTKMKDISVGISFGCGVQLNDYILSHYKDGKLPSLSSRLNIEGSIINLDISEDYYFDMAFSKPVKINEIKDNRFFFMFNDVIKSSGESSFRFVISGGCRQDSSFENVRDLLTEFDAHHKASLKYNDELRSLIETSDEKLKALFISCMNCCLSSYKEIGETGFKGFFAGINYQKPARTYFRDGYWTVQAALPFYPELIRNEIVTLAKGVSPDGRCPSAVISSKDIEDFWSDHYDSPSFFAMMTYDYLCYTGDTTILNEDIRGKKLVDVIKLCIGRLIDNSDENHLIYKQKYSRRDWADNVYREGYVTYDEALYCRALFCLGSILKDIDKDESEKYLNEFEECKKSINKFLWNSSKGYYNNYASEEYVEDDLSLDTIVTVLYGIADENQTESILNKCEELLESKNNNAQQYGDWGVLCLFPFFKYKEHAVQKSSYEFRYHNGGDWPYLDGLYAQAEMINNKDYIYALTRWFDYSMENGWFTPVEYYAPIYKKGSNLQAWSSVPAAALVIGGYNFVPDIDGNVDIKDAGTGCKFNVKLRGRNIRLG